MPFCFASFVFGAKLELHWLSSSVHVAWYSEDLWALTDGFPRERYPTAEDDVIIVPQKVNVNCTLKLMLPSDSITKSISINSFSAEVEKAFAILGTGEINTFTILEDFKKATKTEIIEDKISGFNQSDLMIGPIDMSCYLNLNINGNVVITNNATDKTPNMVFGGATYFGKYSSKNLLASFIVKKNFRIQNTIIYIGTENGVNATINGLITFEEPVSNRHATLIVNADDGEEMFQFLQTIKVGGLHSTVDGAGIITTKTGSRGDSEIRNGHIEIMGSGGNFTGEIRDNFSNEDTRGRMNITMNTPNETQTLGGSNYYTGITYVQNGTLVFRPLNIPYNIEMSGGAFAFTERNIWIRNLKWSNGKFIFDLNKRQIINLESKSEISISDISKSFAFSGIRERKSYPLFEFKEMQDSLKIFANQKCDFIDSNTGITYEGIFSLSENALTILFFKK